MTTELDNEDAGTEGGMSEHLQRYRKYIDSLKQGRSSGISSVFGRASDLLPPDVIEIKPPTLVAERIPKDLNGELEAGFTGDDFVSTDRNHGNRTDSSEESTDDQSKDDDETNGIDADDDFEVNTYNSADIKTDEQRDDDADDINVDEDDNVYFEKEIEDDEEEETAEQEEYDSESEETEELTVNSAQGAPLWTIYFNRAESPVISMADGSGIKNAEGRDDTILALKTRGDQIKFFILSGLVIDPITGNIYVEANDGAFTAAFLNNGWQIQQYRNHEGEEIYYATEPYRPGRDRLTMQITNVSLDPVHGEVSYDSLDGSASMTLKSRKLLRAAES